MKKRAYIWKKTIYNNNFTCKCGNKLVDENGEVTEGLLIEQTSFRTYVYCNKCLKPVAFIRYMEVPEETHGLMGNINDYERRKMN